MLPGNAGDHLHAVVGEWQLLADLSFADYLMWVQRDDGQLVCVAQVRPNTAPTVLLADAVGTLNPGADMPVVRRPSNPGTSDARATSLTARAMTAAGSTWRPSRCGTATRSLRCSPTRPP